MGVQLKRKESIARGAKRLIRKVLAQGRRDLTSQELSVDDRIHEFRRHIKRVRAILRLIREGLGNKTYRSADHRFSLLSRNLSAVRDARACLEAFDSLRDSTDLSMSDSDWNELRASLHTRLQCEHQITSHTLHKASRDLRSARRLVAGWKLDKSDDALVGTGFGRVYAAGRRALQIAQERPDNLSIHTLRKEATYLRNIVEILAPNRVSRLQAMFQGLKSLTADAGKCLDLQLLRSVVLQESVQARHGYATEAIIRRIDHRHKELQAEVLTQAEAIYRRSRTRQLRRMKLHPISS